MRLGSAMGGTGTHGAGAGATTAGAAALGTTCGGAGGGGASDGGAVGGFRGQPRQNPAVWPLPWDVAAAGAGLAQPIERAVEFRGAGRGQRSQGREAELLREGRVANDMATDGCNEEQRRKRAGGVETHDLRRKRLSCLRIQPLRERRHRRVAAWAS